MKVKNLLSYTVLCLLLVPAGASAQDRQPERKYEKDNDVQLRTGFEVEKKISKRFSASWSEELRLKNNVRRVDRIYSDIAFSFKAAKWLRFSAGYTFISVDREGKKKDNYRNYWDLRHRVSLGTTLSHRYGMHWQFSIKERVQGTFLTEDDIDKREKSNPKWVLKSKLVAEYKFTDIPLTPYASVELCNTLNSPDYVDGEYLEKVRSAIGAEYRFNKRNSINFFYRLDYNLDKKVDVKKSTGALKSITEAKEYNSIFSISYKYKF